jgi:hypothetical protein
MEQSKSYPNIDWKKNDYQQLKEVVNLLKAIQERESNRYEMDRHLNYQTFDVIDEVIGMLEDEIDYDPTPRYEPSLAGI